MAAQTDLSLLGFDVPVFAGLRWGSKWPRSFSVTLGDKGEVVRVEEGRDVTHYHGFIHFDRNLGDCALYTMDDRVCLAIGNQVFDLEGERNAFQVVFADWLVVRQFSVSDSDRVVFRKTYVPSPIKALLGDGMTSEFSDFFRYVAEDFARGFSGLKHLVSKSPPGAV